VNWTERAREIAGVPGNLLTRTGAEILTEKLREEQAKLEADE
jgi:hypothetical protein